MVIVENPNPDPSIQKRTVCNHCGATLLYVPADVKSYKSYDYGGGCDIVYYIDCPQCTNKVTVRRY